MKLKYLLLTLILCMSVSSALALTTTIRPNTQGTYATWGATGCTAANGYQCVDEITANTSDYLSTSSTSKKESFNFSNTGLSNVNINNVTLYYYAKYYQSSKNKMQPMIRSGSSDYLGNTLTLTSAYVTYSQTYATNPATNSSWTLAQVEDLQAGMMSAASAGGAYVAQIYAVVDYSIPNSCSDSDGGNITTTRGNVSGYNNNVYYTNSDACTDASTVQEFYCSGTLKQNTTVSCGTDGYTSSEFCAGNAVYRNYTDYNCANGACSSNTTAQLQQTCTAEQTCQNGACVYADSCGDYDGGDVPTIASAVYGYENNSPYNTSDYCQDANNVVEYICSGTSKSSVVDNCGTDAFVGNTFCNSGNVYQNYTDYSCNNGACGSSTSAQLKQTCGYGQACSNGACIYVNTCNDTDSGYAPLVQGTASGVYNGFDFSNTDFCAGSSVLVEFYCAGGMRYNANVTCTGNYTGCSSGACI